MSCIAYPCNLYRYRDMHIYFKGGDAQLGSVLAYPGNSFEEKILNCFREEGIAFVSKLQHNFVLFLQDKQTGESYLVRDRFGIEPLYFKYLRKALVFSQDLAELRKGEEVNENKIRDYLLRVNLGEETPDSQTFFREIDAVPPGCYVHLDLEGRLHCKAYWSPKPADITSLNEGTLFEEFRTRFYGAVDTATKGLSGVGAHLSGGFDSSLVSIAYSRINKKSFPTFFFDLGGKNDLFYADLVAKQIQCPHYSVSPEKDIYSCLHRLSRAGMAPEVFILPSSIHYAASAAAANLGCSAILTGSDGDSVVGHGYGYLKGLRDNDLENFILYQVQLRESGESAAGSRRTAVGKEIVRAMGGRDLKRIGKLLTLARGRFGFVPVEFIRYLAVGMHQKWLSANISGKMEAFLHNDFLESYDEESVVTAPDLYAHTDAEIVANFKAAVNAEFAAQFQQFYALEKDLGVRYIHPFFDKDLFELCLAVPDVLRFGNGKTRWLMRQAMKDLLPPELYARQDKDEFSDFLIASSKALWVDNRDRFMSCKTLWCYVDQRHFLQQMQILLKGKHSKKVSRSLARKLNRIMFLGIWLDATGL